MLEETLRTNFNKMHTGLGDSLIAAHSSSNRVYVNNSPLENIVFATTRYLHRNTPEWRRDIQDARAAVPRGRARFQEKVTDALKIAGLTSLDIGALTLDVGMRASTYAAYYTAEAGSRLVETTARVLGRGILALSKKLYHFVDTSCDSLDHNGTSAPKRYLNKARTYCNNLTTRIKDYVTQWIDSRRNPVNVRSDINTAKDYSAATAATTTAIYLLLQLGSVIIGSSHDESVAAERTSQRGAQEEVQRTEEQRNEQGRQSEQERQPFVPQPTTDIPTTSDTTITNTNAYILTVNSLNTDVLSSIGWLNNQSVEGDYEILGTGNFEQFKTEFTNGNYGILVLTGHHYHGADYLFGDTYYSNFSFGSLPASNSVEAVFFSACNTVKADQETIDNVYKPLIAKFPNLNVIAGFKTGAGLHDGIVPQLLSTERYSLETGARHFAEAAINVNPDRVAVAVKEQDGWYVYSMEINIDNNNGDNTGNNQRDYFGFVPSQLTATPLGIR